MRLALVVLAALIPFRAFAECKTPKGMNIIPKAERDMYFTKENHEPHMGCKRQYGMNYCATFIRRIGPANYHVLCAEKP